MGSWNVDFGNIEKLLLEAANATLSDSFDIAKELLALYAKDVDIPHLKIELQMLPELGKTYNESNRKVCTVDVCTITELLNVSNSKALFRDVYKQEYFFYYSSHYCKSRKNIFCTLSLENISPIHINPVQT